MTRGWKEMARELVRAHNEEGRATVGVPSHQMSEGHEHLRVRGRVLRARDVRCFLWDARRSASNACIMWSVYDEETDTSVVGLGVPNGEVEESS